MTRSGILPPHVLAALRTHPDVVVRTSAQRAIAAACTLRERRLAARRPMDAGRVAREHPLVRRVFSCAGSTTVPGALMRTEDQPPCDDVESNRAFDAAGVVHAFWRDVFGRDSLDGRGMHLIASVHFGEKVDNAWWDGAQMVYGDGDGIVIAGYTSSIEVVAHELAHGLLHSEWDLVYKGQSGALSESFADVFGSMVKQHAAGQSVQDADWLIGSQMFTTNVSAFGLRSLREPGSAYDDPALGGRDPQVAHMRNLVKARGDDGSVHLNSGIPNHAFYRFACALGGRSWKVPGRVWYEALRSGLSPRCNFASFANATVGAARLHGAETVAAVCDAWGAVGVSVTAPRRRRRVTSGG